MTNTTSGSLHRHMPEPVVFTIRNEVLWIENPVLTLADIVRNGGGACIIGYFGKAPYALPGGIADETTFAHVLNVPVTEVIWPGEAVNLFPQWFFAKSPNTGMFVHQGEVHEHMRRETLRLCSGKYSAKDYMEDELSFYCEPENAYFEGFSDRSDDEDELLLTDVIDWDV